MQPRDDTHSQTIIWPNTTDNACHEYDSDALQCEFIETLKLLKLPANGAQGLAGLYRSLYLPMAHWVAQKHSSRTVFIAINGAQGSGKSTTSKILHQLLEHGFNKSVVTISIDDLYLTRQEREFLSINIHPLLATRGVPGTHDIRMALDIFSMLASNSQSRVQIPVFDKANDDRCSEKYWQNIIKPVDIVLLEGWCVSARPESIDKLKEPVNLLEANEDQYGIWRNYVNDQLTQYQPLFDMMDYLIMLKVPSFEKIYEWRNLQEKKLLKHCLDNNLDTYNVMNEQQIKRFIMHYERITRHQLHEMPARADLLLTVNNKHKICKVDIKNTK